jgi:hypothetical protein
MSIDLPLELLHGLSDLLTLEEALFVQEVESLWSKSVGAPMLLDARQLAHGFLRNEEPGKVVPYAGIAVHFYEFIAVLGHEAPEHRSLLCAAHHPMLAFNDVKRRSIYPSI